MEEELPPVPVIDVVAASEKLAAGTRLIDVREQNEWDEAHIAGSEHRPMGLISEWYTELDSSEPVLVLCRSGARSESVAQALIHQAGFADVTNVTGGIMAWAEAGLPYESGTR